MHLYIKVLFSRESLDFRPKSHDICRTFKLSCWRFVIQFVELRITELHYGFRCFIVSHGHGSLSRLKYAKVSRDHVISGLERRVPLRFNDIRV
jgi:hypothetical protein